MTGSQSLISYCTYVFTLWLNSFLKVMTICFTKRDTSIHLHHTVCTITDTAALLDNPTVYPHLADFVRATGRFAHMKSYLDESITSRDDVLYSTVPSVLPICSKFLTFLVFLFSFFVCSFSGVVFGFVFLVVVHEDPS